jgi:hypothetical protein
MSDNDWVDEFVVGDPSDTALSDEKAEEIDKEDSDEGTA